MSPQGAPYPFSLRPAARVGLTKLGKMPMSLLLALGTIGSTPIAMIVLQHVAQDSTGLLQYGPLGVLVIFALSGAAVMLKVLELQRSERGEWREAFMGYAKEQRTDFLTHNRDLLQECERNTRAAIQEAVSRATRPPIPGG